MALRYQDIQVGQELPGFVHEKVTRTDLVKYAGASGDYNPMHHDEGIAKMAGMPSVFAHGMFSMGLLSNVVVNWAGAGSVKAFDVQFRAITWPEDRVTCTGKVTGKREDKGQKLVDVELACETKPGTRTIIGTATVALPVDLLNRVARRRDPLSRATRHDSRAKISAPTRIDAADMDAPRSLG